MLYSGFLLCVCILFRSREKCKYHPFLPTAVLSFCVTCMRDWGDHMHLLARDEHHEQATCSMRVVLPLIVLWALRLATALTLGRERRRGACLATCEYTYVQMRRFFDSNSFHVLVLSISLPNLPSPGAGQRRKVVTPSTRPSLT